MTTWTSTALRALEGYLERNRLRVAASGADADEVVADLRRHVEEEIVALRLPVVTEDDVHQIVRRIGAVPVEESPSREQPRAKLSLGPLASIPSFFLLCCGVVLPVIALGFELTTHLCAGLLFDPVPTWLHVLLVAIVPLANLSAWGALKDAERLVPRWLWLANATASGVSLFYTIVFFPFAFFAVLGIVYFGIGLLPLTPFIALGSTFCLRRRLNDRGRGQPALSKSGWGWTCVASLVGLFLLALPVVLTRQWIEKAGSNSPDEAARAIRQIRFWGSEQILLKECYGGGNRLWTQLFGGPGANPNLARQVYYQVTGKPFNSVAPPLSKYQRAGRELFENFDWDSGLGGDSVAGQVKGLSLAQSRLDGLCDADEGWAYLEWILEFRNVHPNRQREARAEVELPPGGAVSRVTLWINGEEREAAFGGRSQVREAYQKVAVEQRRDPVLVTTSGPDRVLIQCFPIQPAGGAMKIRIGITAPLALEHPNLAALKLPALIERNFAVHDTLDHHVWISSPQRPAVGSNRLIVEAKGQQYGVRGDLNSADLESTQAIVRFPFSPVQRTVHALDNKANDAVIKQTIETVAQRSMARIAIVLDGSAEMTGFFAPIAEALNQLHLKSEMAVWLAQDGVHQLVDSTRSRGKSPAEIVGKLRGIGGQDNLPALVQAWEWAAGKPGSAILWIHGDQPILLDNSEALYQRMKWRSAQDGPELLDVAAQRGPNRLAEKIAKVDGFISLPRLGTLQQDLESLFSRWSGRQPQLNWRRTVEAPDKSLVATASSRGAGHIARLWALDQIRSLAKSRRFSEAIQLAALYQLVTPISGAVVLETQQQFQSAGLTPVDPLSVPVVPEPSTWAFWIVACTGLVLWRWWKRSRGCRGGAAGTGSKLRA